MADVICDSCRSIIIDSAEVFCENCLKEAASKRCDDCDRIDPDDCGPGEDYYKNLERIDILGDYVIYLIDRLKSNGIPYQGFDAFSVGEAEEEEEEELIDKS